jgi:hypothetical protein
MPVSAFGIGPYSPDVKRVLLLLLVLALPVTLPVPASAQVVAPPGNSGVDEYLEVVPEAGGDRPASVPATSGTPAAPAVTPDEVLGSEATRELGRLGADGRAVAETVTRSAAGAAAGTRKPGHSEGLAEPVHRQRLIAGDGRGRVETMTAVLSGDGGGMGVAFPLILAATLAATVAVAGWRRRSHSG